jgi:hypothetical protein
MNKRGQKMMTPFPTVNAQSASVQSGVNTSNIIESSASTHSSHIVALVHLYIVDFIKDNYTQDMWLFGKSRVVDAK